MRRLGFILISILVVLAGLWVGLIYNFPGEAVSRYVEGRVNRAQGFNLVLKPAELRWDRLHVSTAELRRRDNPQSAPLFVLTDFDIPVSWRLFSGLPARARLGESGNVQAFLPWSEDGEGNFSGTLLLEEIALPAVLNPITLRGSFTFSGNFQMDPAAQAGRKLPDGVLEGQGRNLIVTGVKVGGSTLPRTELSGLNLTIRTGAKLTMERVNFQGDVQGSVTGTVTPNLQRPRRTLMDLKINAAFRAPWLAELGDLRPVVESFLKQGRLTASLTGTVGRPRMRADN